MYSKIFPHPVNAQSLSENNSYFLYIKFFYKQQKLSILKTDHALTDFRFFFKQYRLVHLQVTPVSPHPDPQRKEKP